MYKGYQSDDPEIERHSRLNERLNNIKENLQEKNKPTAKEEIASVSLQDQLTFWNCLNEVQVGSFDPSKLTKLNNWVLTGDGSWLVQKNKAGYFGCQKSKVSAIPTLPKGVITSEAFFELTYGKIPNLILQQIVTFFRQVMNKYSNSEAFIQVYWDLQESKYIINVPKQNVSQGSVRYDSTENLDTKEPERYVFVYECHSHNSMNAFWSGTDNADEKELRVFGVFGELNKVEYATKHRFFVGEEEISVTLDGIFELPTVSEQKSVVTLNKQEYLVANTSLLFDDKPRYIFKDKDGNVAYIPVDQVRAWQPVVDIPETWLGSINKLVQPEKTNTETYGYAVDRSQFGKVFGNRKNKKDKSKNKNKNFSQYDLITDSHLLNDDAGYSPKTYNGNKWRAESLGDEYYDAEEQAYYESIQQVDYEIDEAIAILSDHTNGFDDVGMVQMVLESMERQMILMPFLQHAHSYLGEYPNAL